MAMVFEAGPWKLGDLGPVGQTTRDFRYRVGERASYASCGFAVAQKGCVSTYGANPARAERRERPSPRGPREEGNCPRPSENRGSNLQLRGMIDAATPGVRPP